MESVAAFLDNYDETVRAAALRLREIVTDIMPDANEVVTGHKNISYSTDAGAMKGGMVYIAPFKDSVNLGFIDGVDLADPKGLLKGTGKRLRHIKVQSAADVAQLEADIRALIAQAQTLKA